MPPRKQAAIAADPWYRDILRHFHVSQGDLERLAELPEAAALAEIRRQYREVADQATRKARFLECEVRAAGAASRPLDAELHGR